MHPGYLLHLSKSLHAFQLSYQHFIQFLIQNTTKMQVKVVILGVLDLPKFARELALRVLF